MFWQRALITLTLGPLFLVLIYYGGWLYFIPVFVLLTLAAIEYSQIMAHMSLHVPQWLLVAAVWGALIPAQWLPDQPLVSKITLFASLLVAMLYTLWRYEKGAGARVSADWVATMGGIALLGWLGSHFFQLWHMAGWKWATLVIFVTWSADSFAYLVGKFLAGNILGKHYMTPRLSPNKTWEGYGGSVIIGSLFGLLVGVVFLQLPFVPVLLLGIAITIVGTCGDLSISLLKREAGVKDSGQLIPGHGGALDRCDSLLWTIPFSYYLLTLIL